MNKFLRFLNSIHPKNIFFDFVRLTLGPALYLSYFPKFHYAVGAKKHRFVRGSAIVACNHVSYLDGMMICMTFISRRPRIIVANEVLEAHPIMGLFLRGMSSIPVDRNKTALHVSRRIMKTLKKGEVVAIFPEGKIAWDGKMDAIKSGVSFYSLGTGAPVIPMMICDPPKAFRRNHFIIGRRLNPSDYADLEDSKAEFERELLAEFAAMEEIRSKIHETKALKNAKKEMKKRKD